MRALVTTASKHGATTEIGLLIAEVLNAAGVPTEVRPADTVNDLDAYDAVVLGSAVYMGRWMSSARNLVERMPGSFTSRKVWLFSSGPLGDPPVPPTEAADVGSMFRRTGALGHRTFGGRLDRSELAFGERAMTRLVSAPSGDFIPRAEIREWAATIARSLLDEPTHAREASIRPGVIS